MFYNIGQLKLANINRLVNVYSNCKMGVIKSMFNFNRISFSSILSTESGIHLLFSNNEANC